MNKNLGKQLWHRALKTIPGGNGLLSKRPERYLSGNWPTYYSYCKGVNVIDLDGKKFIDMAQMGVGSAILGYANDELVAEVNKASESGVNCTLNSPEEVYLSELLIDLNPFSGGVKYARSGAEAMSIAIRLARAYTKSDKVAFSGYHGWSDWYLATNIKGKNNLKNHLLPGLDPLGVPRALLNTTFPFEYNNSEDFLKVIETNPDIKIICIEGARFDYPKKDFLNTIMQVAKKYNMIIVSDEITSGWRVTDGGVYKINGFKPDIVVYGKGMGGGYAISAVVGKKEIMQMANESFVSSTMWTERIGFVAALKTIDIICREQLWKHLDLLGTIIGEGWKKSAKENGLLISINEFKPLISFKFNYGNDNDLILTIFMQEMLKRGYLASSSIYLSLAHTEEIVACYLKHVDNVFALIAEAIRKKQLSNILKTDIRSDAFKRLT